MHVIEKINGKFTGPSWLKCLIVIIERDSGVVPVCDFDPGGLVLESLSEQLTWNKVYNN